MTARLNALTYLVLGAGVAGTWGLMALGEQREDGSVGATLLRYLWTALPYAVVALTTHFLARTPARRLVVLAGAGGIAMGGLGLLVDGMLLNPDPHVDLTILLLPAYQLVLAVAVLLVVAVLSLRRPVSRA
jgi:hypothetical protein